jgi:phage shock protein E
MGPSAYLGIAFGVAVLTLFFVMWWRGEPRVAKARTMIEKGATLVDVDDPEAFARAHIEGAKNIPLPDLAERAHEIGPVEHPVVVYGRGKLRAARAAAELRGMGYHEVLSVGHSHW